MDAHHRIRTRGRSHLRFSRPRYRYSHPGRGAADVTAAHRRGDVHAQFLHQQSHVAGADTGHRFPRR